MNVYEGERGGMSRVKKSSRFPSLVPALWKRSFSRAAKPKDLAPGVKAALDRYDYREKLSKESFLLMIRAEILVTLFSRFALRERRMGSISVCSAFFEWWASVIFMLCKLFDVAEFREKLIISFRY